jgi:opacity protein-like surface antigen
MIVIRQARPRYLLAVAVALGVAAHAPVTTAAEWTLAPDIKVGTEYRDNARLREDKEQAIWTWGGYVDLGALARWRTETSSVLLRPRVRSSHFPGDEDEDSTDGYLDFALQNSGQRTEWALRGNFASEQVLRGERTRVDFEDPEFDDPEFVETGRVDERRRRTLWRLAPRFSHELTERTDIGGGLSYSDVGYSPQAPGEALDYTTARAEAFFQNRLSPLSRFRTTVFVSSFEVDENNNDSLTYGLRGRYERDVTEVFDTYVDVGVQHTRVEAGFNDEIDDSSTGFLLDVGLRRQWERTQLRLSGGRSVRPGGSGFLRETDQIRLSLHHDLHARWYWTLGGLAQRTDSVDDSVPFNARDYFEVRLRTGYLLTRAWTLELGYAFRHQDYEDTPGSAEANEAFLSLNYQPRGRVWSQ